MAARSGLVVGLGAVLLASSCGSQAAALVSPDDDVGPLVDAGAAVVDVAEAVAPHKSAFQISPNGAHVSYLVSDGRSSAVWVAPIGELSAARAVVTSDDDPVAAYAWAHTSRHVLYERGSGAFSVNLETGATVELMSGDGDGVRIHTGHARPGHVLVGGSVLYLIDVASGDRTIAQQDAGFDGFYTDHALRPVLAYRIADGVRVLFHVGRRGRWQELGGATAVVGFDESGSTAHVLADRALLTIELGNGQISEVAHGVMAVIVHPRSGALQAYELGDERGWHVLDDDVAATLRRLSLLLGATFEVGSRSLDDRYWLVSDGAQTHLFDRSSHTIELL